LNGGVFYGASLSPGLYSFSGDFWVQAGNLTFAGGANDNWVF